MAQAILPPPNLTISRWANKFLYLPRTAAEPGRYKTGRTPYVEEIMDAFNQAEIHRVVVKSSSQVGKSQMLLAIVGYYVHLNPCNIMIVQPTLEMSQDFSRDRLEKMIQDTPILTPLFYDLNKTRNSNQTILSKNFTGGRIVLVGANSASGLASRPIKILLCDEVDRFPISAGGEGDAVNLASKRTSTYWDFKIGLFSTPTNEGASRIDAEYFLGTQEEWQHQCPNCGEFHTLKFEDIQVEFSEKFDEFKNRTITVNSVKYRCPDCGMDFSELTMKNSVQKYVVKNPDALKNGIRSFFINGFASPWVNWKMIMQEWLESQGNSKLEQVVYNTRFGKSYRVKGEFKDENQFLRRLESYENEIPAEVLVLTAGIDVQHNRLEISIFGYGTGEETFAIRHQIIYGSPTKNSTWQKLDEILNHEYKKPAGSLKIARTFIDSGYLTDKVYEFCQTRQVKGVFPIKGKAGQGLPIIYQIGKAKNANVMLIILGVDTLKSEIMSRLAIEKPGAMFLHFPAEDNFERGYDLNYFRQLTAEHLVPRKSNGQVHLAWENIDGQKRNEALDCASYSLAAMKSLNINWQNFSGVPVAQVKSKKPVSRSFDIYA